MLVLSPVFEMHIRSISLKIVPTYLMSKHSIAESPYFFLNKYLLYSTQCQHKTPKSQKKRRFWLYKTNSVMPMLIKLSEEGEKKAKQTCNKKT